MHQRLWGDGVLEVYPHPEPQHRLWESLVSTEVDSLQNSTGRHSKALAGNSSHAQRCLVNDFLEEPCSPEASNGTLMVKPQLNKAALAKVSSPGKDEPSMQGNVLAAPFCHQHHKPSSAPDSGALCGPSFPTFHPP